MVDKEEGKEREDRLGLLLIFGRLFEIMRIQVLEEEDYFESCFHPRQKSLSLLDRALL